jgi:hypothetical protein
MIVFEIVLGLALVLGHRPKWTSWAFLLLVAFFTMLTGFTYLTGYVPSDSTFFQFSKWGPYVVTNMRVTDCGCFGDFIRLIPKTSFFKDVALLVPAIYFVFRHRDMHQLFTRRVRSIILGVTTILLILFSLNNFLWNLPVVDFRPFKVGTNLYEKKNAEEQAAAAVKITKWKLQNKETGAIVELPDKQYMAELAHYPKTEWTVVEQIKTKPAIESTKVSEFSVSDKEGNDVAEDILTDSGHVFMVIAYKLKGDSKAEKVVVPDTLWEMDTVVVSQDSLVVTRKQAGMNQKEETKEIYAWDPDYIRDYVEKVNPLMEDVMQQGAKVYAIAGGAGTEMEAAFKEAIGSQYEWYEADDVLLKTIIRSNPGVVHLKGGKVLEMWHICHLPKKLDLGGKK